MRRYGSKGFVRRSFRIAELALNAPFLRKVSGAKDLVSDLLFRKTAARRV